MVFTDISADGGNSTSKVPGRPTIWFTVGQGPSALAMGGGGGCLDVEILCNTL